MSDPDEILTIKQVARYLKVNERAIYKLAQEGAIPTVKIANQWRFRRSMIDGWLDLQMSSHLIPYNGLRNGADAPPVPTGDLKIADALRPAAIRLDLTATTKSEALDELAAVLSDAFGVRDPAGLRQAVHHRERLCSTAIVEDVAFPHPRRNGNRYTRELAIAVGRSTQGIDFRGMDGKPTHLVVMLCAPSDALHLQVIAKLGRLLGDAALRRTLLKAPGAEAFIKLIRERESSEGEPRDITRHPVRED
jgi:PTS system nitrogen regulatory IIA component